jgi:hypothetical protein
VLGVDYYALIWGLFGALFASAFFSASVGRRRAVLEVVLSTLAGAVCGSIVADHSESRRILMFMCFICGAGSQPIVSAAIKATVARIDRVAGKPDPSEIPPPDRPSLPPEPPTP